MSKTFRTGATLGALAACALLTGPAAYAQSGQLTNTSYQEDFNDLPSTGSSTVTASTATTPGLVSNRDPLATSTGTANAGSLYSFGVAGVNPASDRALGAIVSSSIPTIQLGLRIENNTGTTLSSFDLSYIGEQYRNANSLSQSLTFDYIISSTLAPANGFVGGTYTPVSSLEFIAPATGGTGVAVDGNAPANRRNLGATSLSTASATTTSGLWGQGDFLYLRWTEVRPASGSSHGLAIDDVNLVVAIPEPGTFALALLGMGPLGVVAARRRKSAQK